MFHLKLAIRNLGRNKRRSLLTVSSVLLATMIIVFAQCYIKGIIGNMVENYIQIETGHIKINTKEYLRKERLMPLDEAIFEFDEIQEKISKIEDVKSITGRIKFPVLLNVNNKNFQTLGIAIDPEKEKSILPLSSLIKNGTYLKPHEQGILIGSRLAENMKVSLGDTITIVTSTAYRSLSALNFRIVGIFSFGISFLDKNIFYIPLSSAQHLLDLENAVTEIIVMTSDKYKAGKLAERIGSQIPENYSVQVWNKIGIIATVLNQVESTWKIIFFFFLFISALIITNTMLMSALERTREIGMMMAMGMKGKSIITLFLCEGAVIGFIGGLIGCTIGSIISIILSNTGIPLGKAMDAVDIPLGNILYPQFSIITPIYALILGVATSTISALYPAKKASSVEPTEVLRAN